jgi:hypothetical protein
MGGRVRLEPMLFLHLLRGAARSHQIS